MKRIKLKPVDKLKAVEKAINRLENTAVARDCICLTVYRPLDDEEPCGISSNTYRDKELTEKFYMEAICALVGDLSAHYLTDKETILDMVRERINKEE